jgi:alpha-glucosidase
VHGEEHLAIRRRFIEERYRLIPYIYAVAEHSSRTGDPIMRPLFYDYPDMLETECDMAMQFTLGRDILIAGSPRPESPRGYQACLPAGGWYDYWTGKAVDQRVRLELTPSIETLPVFVRAGTILPRQPLVQSLGQRPQGALELHVYPGNDCAGEIYDDDGHSQGFTRGEFFRQQIHCRIDGGKTGELSFEGRQGSFKPWWDHIRVVIHGSVRYSASLAGQPITVDQQAGQFAFNLPDMSRGGTVTLSQLD